VHRPRAPPPRAQQLHSARAPLSLSLSLSAATARGLLPCSIASALDHTRIMLHCVAWLPGRDSAGAPGRGLLGLPEGESQRRVIEAPCPPCTSHGASIRQPFGAGRVELVLRPARCVRRLVIARRPSALQLRPHRRGSHVWECPLTLCVHVHSGCSARWFRVCTPSHQGRW
jgi:hypothetical protein